MKVAIHIAVGTYDGRILTIGVLWTQINIVGLHLQEELYTILPHYVRTTLRISQVSWDS